MIFILLLGLAKLGQTGPKVAGSLMNQSNFYWTFFPYVCHSAWCKTFFGFAEDFFELDLGKYCPA